MDKFTEMMLAQTGLIGMIGKAERGPVAIEAIENTGSRSEWLLVGDYWSLKRLKMLKS
jgi:tartrate dehydratase beta subunit/fumarate hydratase class I family protein